jgi:inorganic pyrophosphatase
MSLSSASLNLEGGDPETAFAEKGHFEVSIAHYFILGAALFSIFWGVVNAVLVRGVDMNDVTPINKALDEDPEKATAINSENENGESPAMVILNQIKFIGDKVTEGAISFLAEEYLYLGIFSAIFAIILGVTVDWQEMTSEVPTNFPYTATAYIIGSGTSIVAGYVGMRIAVYSNTRTTFMCCRDVNDGFLTAFRGGQVLGFVLVGLAILVLELIIIVYKAAWFDGQLEALKASDVSDAEKNAQVKALVRRLFELVAGYGLGGSSVALFGRVGGGIYTKAADVGADLVGKTLMDLREDDPSNPGTIADNVGDNVGDIAGMGADLFGSLAESTCAALVVSSTSIELIEAPDALFFPLMITGAGIIASFVSVLFVHLWKVSVQNVQSVLKWQIGLSTVFMSVMVLPVIYVLPANFNLPRSDGANIPVTPMLSYGCIMFGLWSGMIIGFITEYYTSNAFGPTLYLAKSCEMGPAPNVMQGLALGYISCIIPILCLAATIGFSFTYAGLYGIAIAALGMLGSLPVALTIDGYGPISDNAGGIAEMSGLPSTIRDKTDALDAAGNTTAAIGKGFAIGSAALVGLALFGAFITRVEGDKVDILQPTQFCGLLIGAMLPYAFSAMCMKAVGDAADKMMAFIIEDYNAGQEEIKKGNKYNPDYDGCIKISTDASLERMIAPGVLVLGSPLAAGFFFGPDAVAGLLAGAIVSGVQVAISASNTGGAWDNAKKEVEARRQKQKGEAKQAGIELMPLAEWEALPDGEEKDKAEPWVREAQKLTEMKVAAVVGDTVGDPLKDTSGPAINILIKLSAITSLVFGSYIKEYNLGELTKKTE